MTVKIPEPITMPTPRAVRETGPRDFLRECSGRSESEMSLSMDLVAKIWRARCEVLVVEKMIRFQQRLYAAVSWLARGEGICSIAWGMSGLNVGLGDYAARR